MLTSGPVCHFERQLEIFFVLKQDFSVTSFLRNDSIRLTSFKLGHYHYFRQFLRRFTPSLRLSMLVANEMRI